MKNKDWVGFLHDSYGRVNGSLVLYDKEGPKLPDGYVCLFHFNRNELLSYNKDAIRPILSPLNKLEQSVIDILCNTVHYILCETDKRYSSNIPDFNKINWISDKMQYAYRLYMSTHLNKPKPIFIKDSEIKRHILVDSYKGLINNKKQFYIDKILGEAQDDIGGLQEEAEQFDTD